MQEARKTEATTASGDAPARNGALGAERPRVGLPTSAGDGTQRTRDRAATAEVTVAWLAAGAACVLVLLLVLGTLAAAVQGQEVDALDRHVSPWIHQFASPPLDAVMLAASFVGSGTVLVPLGVAAGAWLLYRRRIRWAFFVLVTAFGSVVMNEAIKNAIHRPRPRLAWATAPPDFSFPSGHSMNSLALFLALAIVVWALRGRSAGAVAVLIACALSLLVGVSRIYLGAHFLTDVVGGYIGAVFWLLIVATALGTGGHLRSWRARRRDEPAAAPG